MRVDQQNNPERRPRRTHQGMTPAAPARRTATRRKRGPLANRATLVLLLNDVLARELGASLRYRLHHCIVRSIGAEDVARQLLVHAQAAEMNGDELARRILDLGGKPQFQPDEFVIRDASRRGSVEAVAPMLAEDLACSQRAIEGCLTVLRCLNGGDPITTRVLRGVVRSELAQSAMLGSALEARLAHAA